MTPVTTGEATAIELAIAGVEARTGVQVVAAVVARADAYPELPWRAFALGASLAALIALLVDIARPDWLTAKELLIQTLATLGGGGVAGLFATRIPAFAKRFLGSGRAQAEVRQCAESMFLTRELFATPRRDAILVLASQFERRVVIVPDVFYKGRIGHAEWEAVVAQMTPKLRDGRTADAFAAGLATIESMLVAKGFAGAGSASRNALPDALVRGEAP